MKLRRFQLSCPVFWGKFKYIDVEQYNTIDAIMNNFLDSCEDFWKEHNLIDLGIFFKSIRHLYHIHNGTMQTLLNSTDNDVFYICRHVGCDTKMDLTIRNR